MMMARVVVGSGGSNILAGGKLKRPGGGGGVGAPKILKRGSKIRKLNSSLCVPQKGSKGQGSVRTAVTPPPV